jgi:prepilin-type N-terminal cleavage/methylation domain-containing protein
MRPDARTPRGRIGRRLGTEKGFSLLESVIALSLLLIISLGLLPLGVIATTTTENQGHLMARATEYAQDKMEQLLALSYGDSTSDTRTFPASETGGTGLAIGGSSDPEAPAEHYVDYLDVAGTLVAATGTTAPASWYYKRVWEVESGGTNLKLITVTVKVKSAVGSTGRIPQATVASLKTFPF